MHPAPAECTPYRRMPGPSYSLASMSKVYWWQGRHAPACDMLPSLTWGNHSDLQNPSFLKWQLSEQQSVDGYIAADAEDHIRICSIWSLIYAQGQRCALDIVSVLQPPGRRYYAFLSIVFGMVANLDRGTEHLRRVRIGRLG